MINALWWTAGRGMEGKGGEERGGEGSKGTEPSANGKGGAGDTNLVLGDRRRLQKS